MFVPSQKVVLEAAILIVGVTIGFTVIVIPGEVAGPSLQGSEDVSVDVITSPSERPELLKAEPVPALEPLINHSYVGVVPPPRGVGVKTTFSPLQIVVSLDSMLMLTAVGVSMVAVTGVLAELHSIASCTSQS